ncbi:hypothetical protein A3H10_03265 [Candidatus Uhrbacteria bacterium RIFCSPLOWO2_12_FULL_46_10]|uniref:DNA 3'-5' helicase n=1 Tax=Candidatus Uhrbacteria bacterium RIFCSPLOWO2_01_FULL_47_25 TaxID=1802402 RepID=A0A1F7UWZ7_9BACT|nr:MAG: hypothetical protein UX68_C0014G0013 [Parcubacteria group bacterium GW2011_GWA2_46_9]OGL59863.1 MAG: hypothetical protein A2752_03920 [Candidatus Uhrbacteria bacterium RIFCSPHIGHO2_01_FULL_46_23]OGL69564.1 MAG: hypothetical protein A3D60_00150 [Candidatus Uhrbacteria bacterium RIFCSPHIGHO2_02_FULL_47_29]OGL76614.1 MAG: hypothetical protein A3E96_00510 [Candidatus Uhrbacteria bacterium RIFCSPHIGHO2_12_FULL_46_13]OGL82776.1 MAG: hypothetical protein A2936_05575 [Candidatus Uhrbacteria bac
MEFLQGLNNEQKQAVTHGDGPLLIVAGAGTGKTTVVTKRLVWLIESSKAKTDNILALTFTDKAAGEMEERVDKLLPYGYTDLWISTFHSFCERLLHSHALDIGVPYDFKLLSETEQWLLVRQYLNKFTLRYYRPLGNPTKFIHALLRHFSRAKDEEIYPDDYLKYAEELRLNQDKEILGKAKHKQPAASSQQPAAVNEAARIEEVANAYHIYQQLLLEQNALDFGDLINYTLKLFRTRPDILNRYRQQFKYILVDEFQDTNWAQYELVKLLAVPQNNLTVVGDDDQSIYRFRGASMSNILQFKKDYPKAQEVVLIKNYRSSQNILDLAYQFIQRNNPNRLEWQMRESRRLLDDGGAALSKSLKAITDETGIITHLRGETLDDEFHLVAEKIMELKNSDREAGWGDFAVLARSNDQVNQADIALGSFRLPRQSVTAKGLYNKPVIVDALAYFRLLDNYHESQSLWRVLNFPFWKLSGRDLIELSHFAAKKSWSLFEAMEKAGLVPNLSVEARQILAVILKWIGEHTDFARGRRPSELLVKMLNDIGYTSYLESLGEARSRLEFDFLNQFHRRMRRWEETEADPRLKDFMAAITYELESGEAGDLSVDIEAGPDVIKVMTVHAAKGLEFKYVFVVGLVDRRFPTTERRDPIELPEALVKEILPSGDNNFHLEEERRLFYVAMTRAKRGLFFTSAEDYGGSRKKKPSQFLIELGTPLAAPVAMNAANKKISSLPAGEIVTPEIIKDYLPEQFSFTQLKAFETCPWQYRYAHILKVPVWGRHTFSFGKTMHLTLQRFFERVLEKRALVQGSLFAEANPDLAVIPGLDELLEIYKASWIDEWYESKSQTEEYFNLGRDILKEFFKKNDGAWPDVKFLERGFTLKIGPYTLKGQVDRMDVRGDGVEIIDYKTGNVPKNMADVDKDQLLIYQLAAEIVWREKPVALTFYYLNENKPVSFLGTPEDLEETKQKIIKTIEEIRTSEFKAAPSPQKCRQCDFKNICPFSQA